MLNEECITQVEPLCYLILLLDSLGLEVNPVAISRFWTQALQQKELSAELMEVLIFFWKKSREKRECASLTFLTPASAETEQSLEAQPETVDAGRMAIPATGSMTGPQEEPAAKEEPPPDMAVNSRDFDEKPAEQPEEALPHPMTSVIQPEDFNLFGRYIYGIVYGANDVHTAGIDGNPVYTIPYRDLGALVHNCHPKAYQSQDREEAETWLRQHQKVLDEALKHTDSLVPMGFDVIIEGSSSADPDDLLCQWLEKRYGSLKDLLDRFSGRAEYGIKVYGSVAMLTEKVSRDNPAIIELSKRLATMNKGTAYLFQGELSQKIRKAVDEECKSLAAEISAKIRPIVSDAKENKLEPEMADHHKAILNLAVLAEAKQVEAIGDLLENLQAEKQYKIVFTGPWPAYSFVRDLDRNEA
jgi:hypothetical protein